MVEKNKQSALRKGRPWALIGFDLEGIVGALAAWLVGLLLGAIWGPLFWIGFVAAVVILLATRKQERTPPDAANLVIAPCDGVVQSILKAVPPVELRLPQTEHVRVRVSSSPASPNMVFAPITGEIMSIIEEEPNPSVILARAPDLPGLAVANVGFSSRGDMVGLTVATGGFGPRLEMTGESGDAVRAGRIVGKRRLGGWCDVYLKSGARLLVSEGQTLIGSETVLCRLSVEPGDIVEAGSAEEAASSADAPPAAEVEDTQDAGDPTADDRVETETESAEETADTSEDDASSAEPDAKVEEEKTSSEDTPDVKAEADAETSPAADKDEEDMSEEEISEMFEKLKQKADEESGS
ncbi:MAG: hypothetical protein AAF950_16175 [Pseudomonadota bacterium]